MREAITARLKELEAMQQAASVGYYTSLVRDPDYYDGQLDILRGEVRFLKGLLDKPSFEGYS